MSNYHAPRSRSLPLRALRTIASSTCLCIALSTAMGAQSSGSLLDENQTWLNDYRFGSRDPQWSVEFGALGQAESDLDKAIGNLSVSRSYALLKRDWPRSENSVFRIEFLHEESRYDFDGALPLGLAIPFDDVKETSIAGKFKQEDDDGIWIMNTSLALGRETGVSPTEGIYAEMLTGKMWNISDSFQIGIALLAYSKLEDRAEFLPFPIFKWMATDKLSIGFVNSNNPSFGFLYNCTESLNLYLNADYDVRQYRLGDRVALVDGAILDEDFSIRGGLVLSGDAMEFELFGGITRNRISVETGDSLVSKDNTDAAGLIGARLTWRQ